MKATADDNAAGARCFTDSVAAIAIWVFRADIARASTPLLTDAPVDALTQ
jgi:hypothetical protein